MGGACVCVCTDNGWMDQWEEVGVASWRLFSAGPRCVPVNCLEAGQDQFSGGPTCKAPAHKGAQLSCHVIVM